MGAKERQIPSKLLGGRGPDWNPAQNSKTHGQRSALHGPKFEPLPAAWLSLQRWCMLMWNTPATETMLVNRKSNSTVPTWSYTLCVWHLIRPRSSLSSLHLHIFRMITVIIFRRNRGIFFASLSTSSKARYGTRAKWRCCEAPFTSRLNDV